MGLEVEERISQEQFRLVLDLLAGSKRIPQLDNLTLARMAGLAFLEEYRCLCIHMQDSSRGSLGFLTNLYGSIDKARNFLLSIGEIDNQTSGEGFFKFIETNKHLAADSSYGRLDEFSLPSLFAVCFEGFSTAGKTLGKVAQMARSYDGPKEFRGELRKEYIRQATYVVD